MQGARPDAGRAEGFYDSIDFGSEVNFKFKICKQQKSFNKKSPKKKMKKMFSINLVELNFRCKISFLSENVFFKLKLTNFVGEM